MAENVNSKNATIAAAAPRPREEIAESLRVRTRRGTPTEKLEVIMTSAGLDRVEAATVMVIGLGGVGSNCVEALARGGVGHLIVIDHDIVGLSNINRQAIAFHSTLGRKKHEVVRDMVHDINPDCQVEALDMFLPGMFAYRSVLNGGIPMEIPNLRNKAERDLWRHDTMCTDPKVAGDQLIPSYSKGNPDIEEAIYAGIRDAWIRSLEETK